MGTHATPWWYHAVDQKLVDEPVFAFYLNRTAGGDGELLLGGVDEAHYTGEFTEVPLTNETYWEFHMDGVRWVTQPSVRVAARPLRILEPVFWLVLRMSSRRSTRLLVPLV